MSKLIVEMNYEKANPDVAGTAIAGRCLPAAARRDHSGLISILLKTLTIFVC
jgi:hypothetical protein